MVSCSSCSLLWTPPPSAAGLPGGRSRVHSREGDLTSDTDWTGALSWWGKAGGGREWVSRRESTRKEKKNRPEYQKEKVQDVATAAAERDKRKHEEPPSFPPLYSLKTYDLKLSTSCIRPRTGKTRQGRSIPRNLLAFSQSLLTLCAGGCSPLKRQCCVVGFFRTSVTVFYFHIKGTSIHPSSEDKWHNLP